MKLEEIIKEMIFRAGTKFPEYSSQQIQSAVDYLKDAIEITKLEGGHFTLYKKQEYFVLKRTSDKQLIGWVKITPITMFNKQFNNVGIIYILVEFRKTGASLILFHGVKEISDRPLLIDGAVFTGGEDFINSLIKRKMYTIVTIDKKTGQSKEYQLGDITYDNDKNIIVVENTHDGLYDCYLPGNDVKTYFMRFEDLYQQLLENV